MKYLSFDIECCDGKHICEFGYVFIDELYNVLDRGCLTINPERKFRLTGRSDGRDISLAFPTSTYYKSPKFDCYYDRIKSILNTHDCQIIGFSLSNDELFLANACELYDREPINFTYYDIQEFYQSYTNAQNRISLEGVINELQIPDITLHKSDDDSWAVIRALQVIGERENLTLPETLKMLKKRNDERIAEKTKEYNDSIINKTKKGDIKLQNKFISKFIQGLKVSEVKKDDVFFGKTVGISSHFQEHRFNEFLSLVKRLYSYGATYIGKASEGDIFIKYQDGEDEDIRFICVKSAIEIDGRTIQVLSLEECLNLLNLKVEELNEEDNLEGKQYFSIPQKKKRISKPKQRLKYTDESNKPMTIGDILKAKHVII